MTYHVLDRILINTILFSHGDEVFTTIVRSMGRIEIQLVSNHAKAFLVSCVGQSNTLLPSIRINIVEQVWATEFLSLFIFSFNQMANLRMYWNDTISTSIGFHASTESTILKIDIRQFKQTNFLWSPPRITLNENNIN